MRSKIPILPFFFGGGVLKGKQLRFHLCLATPAATAKIYRLRLDCTHLRRFLPVGCCQGSGRRPCRPLLLLLRPCQRYQRALSQRCKPWLTTLGAVQAPFAVLDQQAVQVVLELVRDSFVHVLVRCLPCCGRGDPSLLL